MVMTQITINTQKVFSYSLIVTIVTSLQLILHWHKVNHVIWASIPHVQSVKGAGAKSFHPFLFISLKKMTNASADSPTFILYGHRLPACSVPFYQHEEIVHYDICEVHRAYLVTSFQSAVPNYMSPSISVTYMQRAKLHSLYKTEQHMLTAPLKTPFTFL